MPRPKGGYRLKDGTRVPGVTTIVGRFKDSGGLLWWAFGQGKAAERGEIDSLYDKRDEAANAGTLAHAMVEADLRGNDPAEALPDDVDDEVGGKAIEAFGAYESWRRQSGLVILEQELELVSERWRFGGCPDAIGTVDGPLVLIDWKTSVGVYPDYLIQLAAYKELWEESHPDKPITGGFHLCRFAKEHGDFSHHHWPNLDEAWEQFRLLRKAYDIDKQLKRRAK